MIDGTFGEDNDLPYTQNDHNLLNMIFAGDEIQDSLQNLGFSNVNTQIPGSNIGVGNADGLSTEFGN